MRYKPDWDRAKERYFAWWQGEDCGRPALQIYAPSGRTDLKPPIAPPNIEQRYTDVGFVMENMLYHFKEWYFYRADVGNCDDRKNENDS